MIEITTDHLPTGWTVVPLGTLADHVPYAITDGPFGSNLKTEHYTNSGPRVIRLQNIGKGEFIDEDAHISFDHFERLRKHEVTKGDVVIALLGERLPRACLIPSHVGAAIVKADCARFRPHFAILNPKYINCWLNFRQLQQLASKMVKGVGRPRMNLSQLKQLPVLVPPRREQDAIVAKIEELFTNLDAGVAALERVRASLKRYRATVLNAAVTGKLTEEWRRQNAPTESADKLLVRILEERRRKWEANQLQKFSKNGKTPPKDWRDKYEKPPAPSTSGAASFPNSWCWATVDQLTAGHRSSAYGVLQPGNDIPDGVPFVRVCDVADGRVAEAQLKRIAPALSAQYGRTILQGGEILLTIVGTIGRTAIAHESLRGANTARAVAVIPTAELVDARFVELTLRDSSMRTRLTQAAHEVARKTLNLEDVRAASLPLAPLDEQRQIIAEVERRFSVVEAVEAEVQHGLKRATRLRQAILKRAFEGKLVPQDPSDEPATSIISRLRFAQEHVTSNKPSPRAKERKRQNVNV